MSQSNTAGAPPVDATASISTQSYEEYLTLLQELSLTFVESLDEQEMLKLLMTRATQWMDIPRAELYLVNDDHTHLESRVLLHNGELIERRGHQQKLGQGLSGLAWETGEVQLVHDYFNWRGNVSTFRESHRDPETGKIPRLTVISIPLKVRNVVIGVLDLVSQDAQRIIGEAELKLLEQLMLMASIALENARLYHQTQEANSAKSAFLARISHELRTPLNAIIGYAEMLQEELELEQMDDFAEDAGKIHNAGQHVLALINQLLDLSKIEAGKMECHWELTALERTLSQLSDDLIPLMTKQGNQFHMHIDAALDPLEAIVIDPLKLRQILLNLLSNAAKFTQRGKIELRVSSIHKDEQRWLSLWIEDNGIGMSKEELSTLFDTYTQAHKGTPHHVGTGLGMPITKELCELMGGQIDVKSTPGQGTSFCVTLPWRETIPQETQ